MTKRRDRISQFCMLLVLSLDCHAITHALLSDSFSNYSCKHFCGGPSPYPRKHTHSRLFSPLLETQMLFVLSLRFIIRLNFSPVCFSSKKIKPRKESVPQVTDHENVFSEAWPKSRNNWPVHVGCVIPGNDVRSLWLIMVPGT